MESDYEIFMLLVNALVPNSALAADELDKQWADFGRMVNARMTHPDLVSVLNRALLVGEDHQHVLSMLRVFLITGVRP